MYPSRQYLAISCLVGLKDLRGIDLVEWKASNQRFLQIWNQLVGHIPKGGKRIPDLLDHRFGLLYNYFRFRRIPFLARILFQRFLRLGWDNLYKGFGG